MSPPTKRRVFVSWTEFGKMAVDHYQAAGGACLPVDAHEVLLHRRDRTAVEPLIVLHSPRCGEAAAYRPGIDDDGKPFVQRVSRDDDQRCDRGHRLCCPGAHECSLCLNERRKDAIT